MPYSDVIKAENVKIRTFRHDVLSEELVWHRDLEDRTVHVLESNGWMYQLDNELPKLLKEGDTIFIPKMVWHRVKRGNGPLVIKIVEGQNGNSRT